MIVRLQERNYNKNTGSEEETTTKIVEKNKSTCL